MTTPVGKRTWPGPEKRSFGAPSQSWRHDAAYWHDMVGTRQLWNPTFIALGWLTIWGAPISNPASYPANSNFVFLRFQRGVMHYIAGTGTESILLADYLKAIVINQNVPPDLLQQSRETRFFNQYCAGCHRTPKGGSSANLVKPGPEAQQVGEVGRAKLPPVVV